MLKHRPIVIVFISILIVLVLADRAYDIPWSLYLLVILAFLSIEFYGAYFIHSEFHLKAICKIKTTEKVIALSFDDGPAEQTEKVLKVLEEFNAKATFFCIGNKIKGKENVLQKIHSKGHLIGNHSFTHGYLFDLKNTSSLIEDLRSCNEEIKKVIGKEPAFFRPPYGVTTPGLARAIEKLKLTTIGWNIRSLDTTITDKKQIFARIRERLEPGSILLMHDTVVGIEIVLKEVLLYLKDQNYTIVPLNQLLEKKAYA